MPEPLDPDGQQLHQALNAGSALPSDWYADSQIFAAEREHILRRSWQFVTHAGDLAEPGDVFVRDLAGVPVVFTRGADDAIRGFVNICRHRGHPVVTQAGNQPRLRCGFHGWSYDLEGNLLHAPRSQGDASFDVAEFGLTPVQTEVWGPMVWANLDPAAPSFASWIDGMPELMQSRGMNVDDHAFAFDHTWTIRANWKVFQDNTIECYHCPTAHPEFASVVEMMPGLQTIRVGGRNWIHHTMPFRKSFEGSLTTAKVAGNPFNYYYHWVFPTTYLQYAGRGFDIGSIDVVSVDEIRFRHICFMPPDTDAPTREQGFERLANDPTIHQDIDLCERVQVGHASGLAPTGRILREPEFLLTHFHHLIVELVTGVPHTGSSTRGMT